MLLFKITEGGSEFLLNSIPGIQSDTNKIENNLNFQSYYFSNEPQTNNPNIPNLMNSNEEKESHSKNSKPFSPKDVNIFFSKVKYIRKEYNIKKARKNNIVSLVKKVKSKFLKATYESLKFCLHSCKIKRLTQNFIINTRIEYNKKVLNKTVEEIYTEFKLLPTFETLIERRKVFKNKQDLFYSLMKSKLKDIYKCYIISNLYTMDKKRIESNYGESVVKLCDFISANLCEYFLLNKGNNQRLNRWRSNKNFKKNIFVSKKGFEIHKKVIKSVNNNDNKDNKDNINNNTTVKFYILKFDSDINVPNGVKKVEVLNVIKNS